MIVSLLHQMFWCDLIFPQFVSAIRQQLINTEDIRRMRRKAPCTRFEIWRIQKSSLEYDVFSESIFTGEHIM